MTLRDITDKFEQLGRDIIDKFEQSGANLISRIKNGVNILDYPIFETVLGLTTILFYSALFVLVLAFYLYMLVFGFLDIIKSLKSFGPLLKERDYLMFILKFMRFLFFSIFLLLLIFPVFALVVDRYGLDF